MKLHLLIILTLILTFSAFGQTPARDQGIDLYRQGDFNGAIPLLQQATLLDKNDRRSWIYLGMSLIKTGNNKEGLKILRKGDNVRVKRDSGVNKNDSDYDKELKILSKPRPQYSEEARRNSTRGRVKLVIEFNASGKITMIVPIESLPDGLTENCMEAAQEIEFEPAVKNGKPVTTVKTIEYSLDIF